MKPLSLLALVEANSITGPAKNLLEFADLAHAENVSTTVVTFTRGAPENLFTEKARMLGIAVEAIEERGAFDLQAVRALAGIARRIRPDVIQTHAVKSHFLARLAGLPKIAPWVAFHHGYTWPTIKARLYNQLDRWSLPSADKILTVSRPFRDELTGFGVPADRIEVIHNAIPLDWGASSRLPGEASALREHTGIPPGRKVILIVGRLSREKDHLTLLKACAGLRSGLDPHLVVVGDGPEKTHIEQAIRSLGLEDRVTLTGHQPSAQPWYGIADAAVLSSLSEGSPNALLESMASGIPTVATEVGGIPEIVAHEDSALLVQPSRAEEMEAALRRVLTDPALAARLVARSRVLIAERHAPEARMKRLVAVYRSLIP